MKICAAQIKPVKGDIQKNIDNHKKLIALAVSHSADMIIFPELSITGYEPELAKVLATDIDDSQFDDFQKISDINDIIIGVGMPIKSSSGILISMIIFQAGKPREIYSKQYLHADEVPYFINGKQQIFLTTNGNKMAPAICYEVFVPEHAENAFKNGTGIYIASVAKSVSSAEKAVKTLADIANKYSMTVLFSNCIGHCDNFVAAGKTSIWNNKGLLMGQLTDSNEGILIMDTETGEVIEKTLNQG